MNEPSESEVNFSCAITQLATVLDPRNLEDMAESAAREMRANALANPAKYPTSYRVMYPTLGHCLRMWWKSFIQRMTHNPEYGRSERIGRKRT